MNGLLAIDTELFLDACEVQELDGDDAQKVVAEVLAGDDLVLEQAS